MDELTLDHLPPMGSAPSTALRPRGVMVRVSPCQLGQLDYHSDRLGISRPEVIRQAIAAYLDGYPEISDPEIHRWIERQARHDGRSWNETLHALLTEVARRHPCGVRLP